MNLKRPLVIVTLIYILIVMVLKPVILKQEKVDAALEGRQVTLSGTIDTDPVRYDNAMSFYMRRLKVYAPLQDIGYGDKVEVSGKLQIQSSPRNPMLSSFEGLTLKSRHLKVVDRGGGNPLLKLSYYLKARFVSVIKSVIPPPYDELLSSIILGKAASDLPEDSKEDFKKTGTIHILVVSGMHLAILIGVILAILRLIRLPTPLSLIVITLVNLLYVLIAGAGPSIIRAAVMAEIAVIGQAVDRTKDFLNTAAIAALALLIIDPTNLFNIGFQLSFAATFSLVWLAPVIEEKIKQKIKSENIMASFFVSMTAVSIAPVLLTFPIILNNFNQLSLAAPLTNMLIISWAQILLLLGFSTAISGIFFLPLARVLAFFLLPLLVLLKTIVSYFASLPFACIYLPPVPFAAILIYYFLMCFKQIKRALVVLLVFILFTGILGASAGSDLVVTVLDVGQGDSILVESPSGKKMLVDGGDRAGKVDMGKRVVVPFLRKKGISYLDIVVLTHPHSDHLGGLIYVLENIKAGMVLDPAIPHTSYLYQKFLSLIKSKDIPFKTALAGQVIDLGDGVSAQILAPTEPLIEESELNNNSIVIKLVYKDTSLLLMGDAEKEEEERLLELYPDALAADVLKAGHHGSRTSSSPEFLEAVAPETAIISCGKGNKFKHPHQSTLKKFEEMGIKVYRTDQDGAVVIKSDGGEVSIQNGGHRL